MSLEVGGRRREGVLLLIAAPAPGGNANAAIPYLSISSIYIETKGYRIVYIYIAVAVSVI